MIISETLVGKRIRYVSLRSGAILFRGEVVALGVNGDTFSMIVRCDASPYEQGYEFSAGQLHAHSLGYDETGRTEIEDTP